MRNFQKLKELSDYENLDVPEVVSVPSPTFPVSETIMILRMLVRPKYGKWKIPTSLLFLKETILKLYEYDVQRTGINESWCYVTIRRGEIVSKTDDEWHFDGSSFRTDIIPERNYIWTNNNPTEYKQPFGKIMIPKDFDPIKHNLFTFFENKLNGAWTKKTEKDKWYLLSPFCLHRRPEINTDIQRTFIRICFTDIEGRDVNNTVNPLLPTPFYGRDPVKTFRDKLINYPFEKSI